MTENDKPNNTVPNSIAQIGITTKYTFLEYFRSRRFFILLIITVLISILLTIVVGATRPESWLTNNLMFYYSWWDSSHIGSVTLVIILSSVCFGGDAISGEFQHKTGYFSIPNPVRRSSIYVGKWLSAFLAASIMLGIFSLFTLSNGIFYFGLNIPLQFGESILFAWLYLVAVLGVTFFFSSLFKNSSISILVTIFVFFFGFTIIEIVMNSLVGYEPWFVLSYGSSIIINVLSFPYPQHITTITQGPANLPITMTVFSPTIPEGIAIMIVYFLITTVGGLLLFERKEFT
jgi:ABC-2 type transport system permease protein